MSVSMRSTKAQMYSEIERLRALCDLQSQQLLAASPSSPSSRALGASYQARGRQGLRNEVPVHGSTARRRHRALLQEAAVLGRRARGDAAMRLRRVLAIIVTALLVLALWYTSPARHFPECRGNDVPRYCVD